MPFHITNAVLRCRCRPDDLVMSNSPVSKQYITYPEDSDVKSGDAKCKDSTHVENDYLHALSVKTQGTLP